MSKPPSVLTREAGTSTPAGTPTRRRPSTSHILIALAVILAFGFNYLALQNRDATTLVAVADTDLLAGGVLATSHVRLAEVNADFAGIDGLIAETDLPGFAGWILIRSIKEGDVIDKTSMVEPATFTGMRVMSVPVEPEHAAGGTLTSGDRVDVISVSEGEATFIATDVEVVDSADTESSTFAGAGSYYVILAVEADQALALALAVEEGSVEIVRATGAAPIGEGS